MPETLSRFAGLTPSARYLLDRVVDRLWDRTDVILLPYEMTEEELPTSFLHTLNGVATAWAIGKLGEEMALAILEPAMVWAMGEQLDDPWDDANNLLRVVYHLLHIEEDGNA